MVHLRYFKCNGRSIASLSGLSSAGEINSTCNQETHVTKPSSKPLPNLLPISSDSPIHTVNASDGQVVRIIRNLFAITV